MKIKSKFTQILPFYLFTIGFFLILISPNILSDGMFMDGLYYATIAKNLSNGIGSFWNPHFTATFMPEFHDHPPLAFGIQSIFFTIFGESRYIDKMYSLLTFIIVGYIILLIWNYLGYKNGWFPLFLWITIPLVFWACTNNILENTLSIFVSLSILFYLKSQNSKKYFFILLSGLMLSFGFLTKGFVAFFPWTFPFLLWLLLRRKSVYNMAFDSIGVFITTIIPLILLVLLFPEAKLSIGKYIESQVIHSLKNVTTVDYRFYIVIRLFFELIPAIVLSILIVVWGWSRKVSIYLLKVNYKQALVFFLLGLTGVLPIMISMKQSGFYILTTFPFFALSFGILLNPLVEMIIDRINYQSKGFLIFKFIGYSLFFIGILSSMYFANQIGRDKKIINDTYIITLTIPAGITINILPNMWQDWCLHGYYYRYKNISLDTNLDNKREYFLIQSMNPSDTTALRDYKKVELQTLEYQLYRKK